jgi:hypothetical protein
MHPFSAENVKESLDQGERTIRRATLPVTNVKCFEDRLIVRHVGMKAQERQKKPRHLR